MARRKKEPLSVHRERITTVASALFIEKGISYTTVDEIAKRRDTVKLLYMYILKTRRRFSFLWYINICSSYFRR